MAKRVPISAENIDELFSFANSKQIDLTIVGPEVALVSGIVDRFQEGGLLVAGPHAAAARLEGSKSFSKDFMLRHGIPTADYQVFDQPEAAEKVLKSDRFGFPVVLKADGLAAGKGVLICTNLEESLKALNQVMRDRHFGSAGDKLVIEEFLEGEEASFMVFSDGIKILPMVPSQDHKAIYEGDQGSNTGGMGAYSTDSILSSELRQRILNEIIKPTISGMAFEGHPYQGILYAGLMINSGEPRVLEFNVRFGDPEAQVVLPRLETDLLAILTSLAQGNLDIDSLRWSNDAVVCVVIASSGYPGSYEKGKEISGLDLAEEGENTTVFHAGTDLNNGKIVTAGGRVLGVTSTAPSLDGGIMRAYEAVNKIHFDGMYYRRDIAGKGLKKLEGN